jgi:hypothetical protein
MDTDFGKFSRKKFAGKCVTPFVVSCEKQKSLGPKPKTNEQEQTEQTEIADRKQKWGRNLPRQLAASKLGGDGSGAKAGTFLPLTAA